MCGIAGFAGSGDESDLRAMVAAVAHRGPDGEGILEDRGVWLGHRRLAVLDLAGGHQPMRNEDGSVAVVFNGEIYNHAELRVELERLGHRFRTDHSDTEVLVHGWEAWGEALPARLNGMFAFAAYDAPRRLLFLARDRFGEKPLYYARHAGGFAFASELSALARHRDVSTTLDDAALQKFFAYGFLPAPNALYRGTRKLPGGCSLTYAVDGGTSGIRRWWRFRIEADESLTEADDERLAEELRHLLEQAVRRRLISDVPLGVFLSGGIDSASVLALAARSHPPAALRSFTIGFTEPSFDESAAARRVADAVGSQHHEEICDLDGVRDAMPRVLRHLDEPLGDASILPTQQLCAFTRRHVTVALSGDGGDELFAGYDPFAALAVARAYQRTVPRPLHRGLRGLASLLPIASGNMSLDFKIRRTLTGLSYPRALWNAVWLGPLEPDAFAQAFERPLAVEALYEEALAVWNAAAADDLVDRTLEFYTNLYLQDDILTKVDRAAMAVSLESRAVFLDNDVVDFCRRLPHRFKLRNGTRKYLLKRAMQGLLPDEVLQRPKKGFGIPLAKWLREVPATPPLQPVPGMRDGFAERMWQAHRQGRADHRLFLWSWLSLQAVLGREGQMDRRGTSGEGDRQ